MPESADRLRPGARFGRFTVVDPLGAGGMGRVVSADDPTLRRRVAIKVLVDAVGPLQGDLLSEARAASRLNHPNICTIYEVGEVDGLPFIAMELLEGRPLHSLVAAGPLPTDTVVRLGLQVASALAHAHDRGVVHGDLKAHNVMVTPQSGAKLLDFGLARTLDSASLESITRSAIGPLQEGLAGTLPYMAPEMLKGASATPAADVWALGVLLQEMAAGTRPFVGDTSFELAAAILNSAPAPLPASVPPSLAAIIARCLEKDPTRRYATAREPCLALEPLAAPATSPGSRRSRASIWTAAAALLLAAAGGAYLWNFRPSPPVATRSVITSLAVLPFDNLSRESADEYFADGMTDAVITDLSRIPSLKVISRTSSSRYRTLAKSSQEIGRDLGVEAIVDGSVLRARDDVRISVRLVDAATDRNIWVQDYTRRVEDVLALQADVARAIAAEIRTSFMPADQARFDAARPISPKALEEYLKGRHQWNRRTPDSLRQAVAHFRQAVTLQPDYAAAFAGIAQSYVLLPAFPLSAMSPAEALPEAKIAAERALALDSRLAEAHSALAYERLHSLDWPSADAGFRRALAVNPNDATAHFWYAATLAAAGRFTASIEEARRAQALDPVSPIIISGVAWMQHLARQFEGEVESAQAALVLDPNFMIAHYRLGEGLLQLGKAGTALDAFVKARTLSSDSPDLVAVAAYAHARAGRRREALDALRTLTALRTSGTRYVSAYALALVAVGLGDKDQAFTWLGRAVEERAWGVAFLGVEPDWDPLRTDPRFAALMARGTHGIR